MAPCQFTVFTEKDSEKILCVDFKPVKADILSTQETSVDELSAWTQSHEPSYRFG